MSDLTTSPVLIDHEFLAPAKCTALISQFEGIPERIQYGSNQLVWWTAFAQSEREFWIRLLKTSATRLEGRYQEHALLPESLFLAKLDQGGSHILHSDNSTLDEAGIWRPNHTAFRAYTVLIYLNGDFEGGEIEFPQHELRFKPQPGMWLGFPSNEQYLHSVNVVSRGCRYSVAIWFTKDPSHQIFL